VSISPSAGALIIAPPAGAETAEGTCRPQENRLTLIYTLGLFAVNFGPVPVGPVLDIWGPRLVSVLGCGVSVLGLVLFGVSHSGGFDAFCAASLLMSAHSRACLAEQSLSAQLTSCM